MSAQREDQWSERFARQRVLQASFIETSRYDRAGKVSVVINRAYKRWAVEVFDPRARFESCPAGNG